MSRQRSRENAAIRRSAFAVEATSLADLAAGRPTRPYTTRVRLTRAAEFRISADDSVLVVLIARGETAAAVDAGLAWGLACQGDRDLLLVLPDDAELTLPTTRRLAWVVTPVHLFGHRHGALRELPIPARVDVRAGLAPLLRREVGLHLLHRHEELWVAPLVAGVQDRTDASPRTSYLAWHADGRQVLRITRTSRGLSVIAGVNYSRPSIGRPAPVTFDLIGPMTPNQITAALVAVDTAITAREAGDDSDNREHSLQSRLATPKGIDALGLVGPVIRELPARRVANQRAFIDLLGVDRRGGIHVIETKLGHDPMLALQGLDYAIWLESSLPQVVDHLRRLGHTLEDRPAVTHDYVVGTATDDGRAAALHTLVPQLEALSGSVRWRVGIVTDWRAGTPRIAWSTRHDSQNVPGRAEPPRFERRLQAHLAGATGGLWRHVFLRDLDQATLPEARGTLLDIQSAGLAHKFLNHVRSSQLFAINLFGGLSPSQLGDIVHPLLRDVVSVEAPIFEYADPRDSLNELPSSNHQTQVDVLLRCTTKTGRHLLLIEVKLSEDDFGHCTGYQATDADRSACLQQGPFGGTPGRCHKLRQGRRYDAFTPADGGTILGCPFRCSGYQPMRNLALARALIEAGKADAAIFALCAHDGHAAIWRRWDEVKRTVRCPPAVSWADLPASAVAATREPAAHRWLAEHYDLPGSG